MLELTEIRSFYGAIEALKGVSIEVRQGEIVALIGANGAGKSTLLMTIFGSPRARHGTINFLGRDISRLRTHEIARLGIAQAPEGRRVFPRLTVLENLKLGAILAPAANFDRNLARAFAMFPRLQERQAQRAGTLSGGEQQMLAIARALMSEPKLLLLDEPSLGLAPLIVRQIFAAIAEINREHGTTVLLVEQNAHQALKLANRAYVLVNGRIQSTGTGAELLASDEVREAYLGGAGHH
jgi:branched-chain amino acid transport system ATP-binding protein